MTVIQKLVTLLRGSARELGQSVVDSNATRIYEQEIEDARNSIAQAKTELTAVMAREMQAGREVARIQREIQHHEDMALQALNKGEEALALQVAERVAALEGQLQEQLGVQEQLGAQVHKLKELLLSAEARVREHEREIGIARTTESVYRAAQSISDSMGATGSQLGSARASLERIKKRHEDLADRMAAAEALEHELGDRGLHQALAAAGIGDSPQSRAAAVMQRLRARQQGAETEPPKPGEQGAA